MLELSRESVTTEPVRGSVGRGVLILALLFTLVFALLSVETAISYLGARLGWEVDLLAALVSTEFARGSDSIFLSSVERYAREWSSLGPHILLGTLSMVLGALQFVPALRRRHPKWHRASGFLVWLTVGASMLSSLVVLASHPMRETASGPAFHAMLVPLAVLILTLLTQAILAALARDFRSHMIWMALAFAFLLGAPGLRLGWMVVGNALPDRSSLDVNLGSTSLALLFGALVMGVWLALVGDRDLPARAAGRPSAWPRSAILAFSVLSAVAALREGVMVPLGLPDVYAAWRDAGSTLPAGPGVAWAVLLLASLAALPSTWAAALQGHPTPRRFTGTVTLCALAAIVMGATAANEGPGLLMRSVHWLGWGLTLLLVLWLSTRPGHAQATCGRNPWLMLAAALLWMPAMIDGPLIAGLMLGMSFADSMAQALGNGLGGLLAIGLATGFGAQFRWSTTRRSVPTAGNTSPA